MSSFAAKETNNDERFCEEISPDKERLVAGSNNKVKIRGRKVRCPNWDSCRGTKTAVV